MEKENLSLKEIIETVISNGLFKNEEESYFTWQGCDYCSPGLSNTVYDCKGYLTLQEAQEDRDNYYEFKLCGDCLYTLYYGE
jgi:Zn-dependent M28 family amino/carboxypeptidase